MQFGLLGPLEATADGKLVPLGGTKQRATLGYLLLRTNRVVAASELVQMLWDSDDAPVTARKILHNAIWGLRSILASLPAPAQGNPPALVTRAPGYVLRVDPDHLDLSVFQRRVSEGRAALAADAPETAAQLLREGLDLWRGPVLADLSESGFAWPEIEALRRTRLDALEVLFDAELACGRHHSVIGDLTTLVDSEPLRERACGQLMIALYRCGRQADALNVYDRARSALVDNLGLEPGHGLRTIQHSILTHDSALAQEAGWPVVRQPSATLAPAPSTTPQPAAPPAGQQDEPPPDLVTVRTGGATTVTQRVAVTAVLVNLRHHGLDDAVPGEINSTLCSTEDVVGQVVERFGGTVTASIGSVSLALFGVHGPRHDDPERAVRAALALRERFADDQESSLRAAVTTGQALVRLRTGADGVAPLTAVGSVLDDGRTLLTRVPEGEVWMSAATRRAAGSSVVARPTGDVPDAWRAMSLARHETGGVPDRSYELGVLNGLLDWARNRSVPHLVTVLGAAGVGKSHLLKEFRYSIARQPEAVGRILVAREPAPQDGPGAVPGQILAEYSGLLPGDPARVVREKLTAAMWRLPVTEERRGRLRRTLLPLLPGMPTPQQVRMPEVLAVWSEFLAVAAALEPLVVILDDVHRADDALLDRLERLADGAGSVPLIVVATARPELLERRPGWGGGRRRVSTLTLLPPANHPPAATSAARKAALESPVCV
ncbi:BTAD domain-containing putative transcriptional regulator [Streptomyces sp. NBC_00059]|uniref:BTAD domain-containing putative transcriptional regulator n=1 Tax=Streptomyces sp. NBC_00059 TaxID=2975635 RepID=UPI00224ED796|nr:BTAD domain-containing putative transcriptional regulator [Streptomyces sp. NBC_00059]MCX5417804.1 AAA family ATPase [Streptomyces sp. NBC_00059]